MKPFIVLACLCLISYSSIADDLNKEKKALIESIKANYDSWLVSQSELGQNSYSDSLMTIDLLASSTQKNYQSKEIYQKHIFCDFTFKICDAQAVVKFQVDLQMISAFMEKRNGEWHLVCAAVIPPDL